MRRLLFFLSAACCIAILSTTASAQTTYTWNQTGTASWATAANWTPTRTTPATNDILVFNNGATTTATNVPTQTIGQLSVSGNTNVTLQAAGAVTLTIGGDAGTDLSVAAGSSLNCNVANAITMNLSSGATGSISGSMALSNAAHRLTAADASGITFNSGATFTEGTAFSGNPFGTTSLNSIVFASGSTFVFIAGSNPFAATAPSSVVVFQSGSLYSQQSTATPSFSGRTYANFEMNVAGTVSVTGGSAVVIDNLTITQGTFNFNMTGTPGHAIKGNISVTGTLNFNPASAATLNLSGAVAQTISGAGTLTFQPNEAVSITNTNGVTLNRDLTINGALTISGTLDQGASANLTANSTLTVAAGGTLKNLGTGDLTLGGNFSISGTVTLNGGGSSCGDADAILIRSTVPGTQRAWSGSGSFVVDLIDVDVQDQAGTLSPIVVSGTDSGNNGATWTFRSSCAPSVVKLAAFNATRYENGQVWLEWQTGLEVDNLGFNIYRDVKGKRERVNAQMLAGSALMVGAGTRLMAGRAYAWTDAPSDSDAHYWLEAIDLNGQSEWHGPVAIDRAEPRPGRPPANGRAMLLSNVGNIANSSSAQIARVASVPPTSTARLAVPLTLVTRHAVKLSVNQEGWYRVTQPELVAAGFDAATNPQQLSLFAEGQEQAISVSGGDDGRFDKEDAIEFYGLGLDTLSTNTRTYWLVAGEQTGLRIKSDKGKGTRAAASGFPYTVERKDRTVYFSGLRNGDQENFFGAVITPSAVAQSLTVTHLDRASTADAMLEVALQGVTAFQHRVNVQLNGGNLGDIEFYALGQGSAKFTVPHAALIEGQNTVLLKGLANERDVSLVDTIRLTYSHAYTADGDTLRFTASNKRRVTIDGFSRASIRIVDVTEPDAPREMRSTVEARDSGFAVTINTPKDGTRTLLAFTDDRTKSVARIVVDQPANLRDKSQGADLVIIARKDFFPAIEPLKALRQSEGLSVAVVDIEAIYDEFNFGEKSPQAVKDFLAYAHRDWSKAPRFALFVGDASFDAKNYLGFDDGDIVPTKLVDTVIMETASDEWLADFDGDGLAEMALGRLPVRTADEAAQMIAKIVSYDSATMPDGVLLVSDSNDGINFESSSSQLREIVPEGTSVAEIVRGRQDDDATKNQILASVSRGQRIVNYFGHGNIDQWRGNILTASAAREQMASRNPSLFLLITCLNGYFNDPALESLAESIIKSTGSGAVAVWASSGMCDAGGQSTLNMAMFHLIFDRPGATAEPLTLGEAAGRAKAATTDLDIRRSYILFGDPSMRLR